MKLMVIDGNSVINRAFFGVRLLSNRGGLYTNAVYGFLTIVLKLLDEQRPDALCVCFDTHAPTFRHEAFEGYKASRKGMPDELAMQVPVLKEVLDAMNVPRYELEGYEADDLIGTISRVCEKSGWQCDVVTGDRDSFQLISDSTTVLLASTSRGQTETKVYTPERLMDEYGLTPHQMIDLKSLMGDKSDEIPGVPGVGEKTGLQLMQEFSSLEKLYDNLDSAGIRDSLRKKLEENKKLALLSYDLAKIDRDVPIEFSPENALRRPEDGDKLYELFVKLEFKSLITRFNLQKSGEKATESAAFAAPECQIAGTSEALDALLRDCGKQEFVALAAPQSLDAVAVNFTDKTVLVRRCDWDESAYTQFLQELFSEKINKTGHDIKPLLVRLLEEDIKFGGFVFDSALGAYLLNPSESSYEMEKTALRYLSHELGSAKTFEEENAFSALGEAGQAGQVLCDFAAAARALYDVIVPEIRKLGMDRLFYEVELPLCRVLAEMQNTGFKVDKKQLEAFSAMLAERIDRCERAIYLYAGEPFNINSTKQLGQLLFQQLELPVVKKTKTGYSTDIEVLEKLKGKHPIIDELMEYRQLTKLKSTYADGLIKVIAPDGRIHSSFNMTVTTTGRISSTEPNLQNIPVRQDLGSEIRRMFTAGEKSWRLIDADYSQIELRVLAHISDDTLMKQAFFTGEDIHTVTASQVFHVPPEEVTPLMRRHAKAVNFGIVYGISDFSLSQDIGVTRAEARQYMDNYFEKYAGVRAYMNEIIEQAKKDGFVTTIMGRRRYLPELKSSNFNIRSFGERVALNTPIQGSAADIIKAAMAAVHERLLAEKMRARLILQVHDELIVEAPEEESEKAARILTEEMEKVVKLSVPLLAEASVGYTWYDAKK